MIILTSAQADKVRGRSPTKPWCAINPTPLRDGTFYVSDGVVDDPAHADVKDILAAGTKVASIALSNQYDTTITSSDISGAKASVDALALPSYDFVRK